MLESCRTSHWTGPSSPGSEAMVGPESDIPESIGEIASDLRAAATGERGIPEFGQNVVVHEDKAEAKPVGRAEAEAGEQGRVHAMTELWAGGGGAADARWRRGHAGVSRGRSDETSDHPHVPPLVRDPPAGSGLRHPDRSGVARPQRRENNHDLYARAEPGRPGGGEPTRPPGGKPARMLRLRPGAYNIPEAD